MKKLPLLSSDFKKFSWENSIGTATDKQVQEAYQALVNKDFCLKFKNEVWNDLVDVLSKAINEAGLSWDNTYGTIEETKMKWYLADLTAFRFNAVTLNISNLIGTVWRWEVDSSTLGYLGRRRVYGVKERKYKADNVYGWYILELARVINVFIDILKNDANFGELIHTQSSNTNPDAKLTSSVGKPLTHTKSSTTNPEVKLVSNPSMPLYVQEIIKTAVDIDLIKLQPKRMNTQYISSTKEVADVLSIRPKYIGGRHRSQTTYDAVIRSLKVLKLFSRLISSSNIEADLKAKMSRPYESANQLKTLDESELRAFPSLFQKSEGISQSNVNSQVRSVLPRYINDIEVSRSTEKADLFRGVPKQVKVVDISETLNSSVLSKPKSRKLESKVKSNSSLLAKLGGGLTLDLVSNVLSNTKEYVFISFHDEDAWAIQDGANLYIKRVWSSEAKENDLFIDCDDWLDPIQDGTNLYIRQMYDFKE